MKQRLLLFICTICCLTSVAHSVDKQPAKTLYFTENKNQWDPRYLYQAKLSNGVMFVEKNAFQYYFVDPQDYATALKHPAEFWSTLETKPIKAHALRVSFENAQSPENRVGMPLPFHFNYFIGSDPKHWASDVNSYSGFELQGIYQATNLKVKAIPDGPVKYDLILEPGADPNQISLYYEGADALSIKSDQLFIKTSVTTLVEGRPIAWQRIHDDSIPVQCYYEIRNNNHVGFVLGEYNHQYALIIDPLLIFSTYSGSTADNFGSSATYDSEGNLFSAGITESISAGTYPTTQGAFMMYASGGSSGTWPQPGFACDITVSKYNNDGSQLLYATYLGGYLNDYPHSLVVDQNDQLILMGSTLSTDFPTTNGAFDRTHNDSFDIIITKFSRNGSSLMGSTYVGGTDADGISVADTLCAGYMDHMRGEVIVDKNNDILVGSVTNSNDFPFTSGALQDHKIGMQDGVVFKLDSALKSMKWSTFLGDTFDETLNSLDVDTAGNVFVTGGISSKHAWMRSAGSYNTNYIGGFSDAYLAKINPTGTGLLRFMYWGSISYDQGYFVKIHTNGDVYMMGQNFDTVPVTPGVYFNTKGSINISCFNNSMNLLKFSTRLGNTANKNLLMPSAFMVDLCGNVYGSVWGGPINISSSYKTGGFLMGATSTTINLQTTAGAIQTVTDNRDFYLFELSASLTNLLYGTYMGEIGSDDHVDGGTSRFDHRGIVYQSFCASCGSGVNGNFPTTPTAYAPKNFSLRCSNASMKLDFRKSNIVTADFSVIKAKTCTDSIVRFINNSYNGVRFNWYINGQFKDTTYNYTDTFRIAGKYAVKLVVTDSSRCNIIDSLTKFVDVSTSADAQFVFTRDTCTPNVIFKNTSIADNNAVLPFIWNFGDGDTSSAKNPVHLYKKNGTYKVTLVVNYATQCRDTAFATINYDSVSQLLSAKLLPFDTLDCEPAQIHITNSGSNGKQFYWYINGVVGARTKNFDSTMAKGDYTIRLIVVDSGTCKKVDSASVNVHVFADVTPDFIVQRDTCSLTINFKNTSNLPPGDSINFVWFFGDGDTSVKRSPVHTFPNPGKYMVQLFANPRMNCVKQKDVWIFLDNNKNVLDARFNPLPPFGCRPQQFTFDNTSLNGSNFYWYIDHHLMDSSFNFVRRFDTSGTYLITLIAIDSGSCKKSDTVEQNITVYPFADAQFTAKRDTCTAAMLIFNTTDTINPDTIHYLWQFGDGDSSTAYKLNHTYTNNGNYTLRLITNPRTLCADTLERIIIYDSIAHRLSTDFTIKDSLLCIPAYLKATNTSTGSGTSSWYVDNILKASTWDFVDTFNVEGKYKIKLIINNPNSCKQFDSTIKEITVKPAVNASFVLERDSCSLDITFINTSNNGTLPPNYLWNFGDGDTSTAVNPQHKYKSAAQYTIRLVSNPGSYCADTSDQIWMLNGDTDQVLFIPNVFTPNNDKLNDCFFIRGVSPDCDDFHLWIRNRWGDLLFESTDPYSCWNGKSEAGLDASEGVYFYILKLNKNHHQSIDKSGTVTLIRN